MEKNLFTSIGRIKRSTYWGRLFVAALIGSIGNTILTYGENNLFALIGGLVYIAAICFMIIQGIKRVHDLNKSGWHSIIPIYSLFLFITHGTPGPNKYGDDPTIDYKAFKSNSINAESSNDLLHQQKKLLQEGICPQCKEKIDPTYAKCFSCDFDFFKNNLIT